MRTQQRAIKKMKILERKYDVQMGVMAEHFKTKEFFIALKSGDPLLIQAEKEKLRKMPNCSEKYLIFRQLMGQPLSTISHPDA